MSVTAVECMRRLQSLQKSFHGNLFLFATRPENAPANCCLSTHSVALWDLYICIDFVFDQANTHFIRDFSAFTI